MSSINDPDIEINAPDFDFACACKHEPPLRALGNGEWACDKCCHVAGRVDGSAVTYPHSAVCRCIRDSMPTKKRQVTA